MPVVLQSKPFISSELFRYATVHRPKIIDLKKRAMASVPLDDVMRKSAPERKSWATQFIQSDKAVLAAGDLAYPYFASLKIESLPKRLLPTREQLLDPAAFASLSVRENPEYRKDHENSLLSLAACKILRDRTKLREATALFNFIDLFPDLHKRTNPEPYAPAILERIAFKRPPNPAKPAPPPPSGREFKAKELRILSEGILVLWKARNNKLHADKQAFDQAYQSAIRGPDPVPESAGEVKPSHVSSKKSKSPASGKNAGKATEAAPGKKSGGAAHPDRKPQLVALKTAFAATRAASGLNAMLKGSAKSIAEFAPGKSEAAVSRIMEDVKGYSDKYGIPLDRFCAAFDKVVWDLGTLSPLDAPPEEEGCLQTHPELVFADTIRILGRADLIKVEETLVEYTPGEISYIENILAGELRNREVKNTKYFEQSQETLSEDTRDLTQETTATAKTQLSAQIETELNTRFDTDVNSSANASGSGKIGIVNLQGGANVDASLKLGFDAGLDTSEKSEFSQEIINKAVEKTKKSTLEKRSSRSYALYEIHDRHAIDNTMAGAESRNGVYCFLDKHICISETVYGQRVFMLANISMPGNTLRCEKLRKLSLSLGDLGEKPLFDITPGEINPDNYKRLAGRFKAQGVNPPPSPIQTLARTYKTDTTNVIPDSQDISFKKVADVLVPFFEKYKRYLITETLKLPEGYEVMEVNVTVNHGANGVSVPAHLPITLAGAAMYMGPSMASYSGFGPLLLPYWAWHIAYMASPLLHYNADSSNVTVCVGNESQDSPYYFFPPDFLMRELLGMMGNLSGLMPDIIAKIKVNAATLLDLLATNGQKAATEVGDLVRNTLNILLNDLKSAFEDLKSLNPTAALAKVKKISASINLDDLKLLAGEFFQPLADFIGSVLELIQNGLTQSLSDLFGFLTQMFDNSQELPFFRSAGARGELPVSLNTVAIKPGVTINLSVCLRRTEEAMDKWRLQTFNALYQSHLQLLSEYESKAYLSAGRAAVAQSPGVLRMEEHAALKEKALLALNHYHGGTGNAYTLETLNFFEHAVDWDNMSYKVFNYGPGGNAVGDEKLGIYAGADGKRKAFLNALWAQALIPIRPDAHLEKQMLRYFEDGTFDTDGELTDDELAALYGELILSRETVATQPPVVRSAVIPTDFIWLQKDLPKSKDFIRAET